MDNLFVAVGRLSLPHVYGPRGRQIKEIEGLTRTFLYSLGDWTPDLTSVLVVDDNEVKKYTCCILAS
jgi:hypothetical protein